METNEQIKKSVKEKYASIAESSRPDCGCGCSDSGDYSIFNDDYKRLDGYVADADVSLGCGLPTQYARLQSGHTVIDLGSGAGNDVFVARALVGESGRVIGIDMTEAMISKARQNNAKLGFQNVEFRLGDIENIPLKDNYADVVVSNCVLNLVPDKKKAFAEIFRVLKPGGHFCISDVVLKGELTEELIQSAEAYAGCISGALQMEEYLQVINDTGFTQVEVNTLKEITLPRKLLESLMETGEVDTFYKQDVGIFSITVSGNKGIEHQE